MIEALPSLDSRRQTPAAAVVAAALVAALLFGALLPNAPMAALAVAALVPLAFLAPTATVAVLLFVTVLVPFDIQNRYAVIGAGDYPGLLAIDVLLLLGLLRLGFLVVTGRMRVSTPLLVAGGVALILSVALVEGIAFGASASDAGHEARRVALGVGTFVLAWPLLPEPDTRRRLLRALAVLGIALGVWGLVQWLFNIAYTTGGDVGVRPGVDLTSSGRGQLQGGLYAYPVAVTLALAFLVSGRIRSAAGRGLVGAVLILNGICLLLTFERTFWVTAVIGCGVAVMLSGPRARRMALRWAPVGAVAAAVVLLAIAPGQVRTAAERLLSVSQASSDESFASRVVESKAVVDAIKARPLTGSGFGATVTWGERNRFATVTTPFNHNGYLWLSWKLGVPAALLLLAIVGMAILRRRPPDDDWDMRALRTGSKGALLGLLLVNVTFPAFNALGITAVGGLLVAACLVAADAGA